MQERFDSQLEALGRAVTQLQQIEGEFTDLIAKILPGIITRERAQHIAGIVAGMPQAAWLVLVLQAMADQLPPVHE